MVKIKTDSHNSCGEARERVVTNKVWKLMNNYWEVDLAHEFLENVPVTVTKRRNDLFKELVEKHNFSKWDMRSVWYECPQYKRDQLLKNILQ
jgi:hypothetical protein